MPVIQRTALLDARVFDRQRLSEPRTVAIDGTVIGDDPSGAEHADVAGAALLPDLIDAHVHRASGARFRPHRPRQRHPWQAGRPAPPAGEVQPRLPARLRSAGRRPAIRHLPCSAAPGTSPARLSAPTPAPYPVFTSGPFGIVPLIFPNEPR
jgi:hypothetical protein